MKNLPKKLENLANVAIIVIAVLLGALIIQKMFFTSPLTLPPVSPTVGTKLSIPNYNWSERTKTVLLILQKGCRFCSESASFYQRLVQEIQNQNVKIIAILPQSSEDAQKYLEELGLKSLEIRQSTLSSLQIRGTPTVIIANNKGEVINVWVGKLSSDKEVEVISHLKN